MPNSGITQLKTSMLQEALVVLQPYYPRGEVVTKPTKVALRHNKDFLVEPGTLLLFPFKQETTAVFANEEADLHLVTALFHMPYNLPHDRTVIPLKPLDLARRICQIIQNHKLSSRRTIRETEESYMKELGQSLELAAQNTANKLGWDWIQEMYSPTPSLSALCDPFDL
jgi:hypothetical protein